MDRCISEETVGSIEGSASPTTGDGQFCDTGLVGVDKAKSRRLKQRLPEELEQIKQVFPKTRQHVIRAARIQREQPRSQTKGVCIPWIYRWSMRSGGALITASRISALEIEDPWYLDQLGWSGEGETRETQASVQEGKTQADLQEHSVEDISDTRSWGGAHSTPRRMKPGAYNIYSPWVIYRWRMRQWEKT